MNRIAAALLLMAASSGFASAADYPRPSYSDYPRAAPGTIWDGGYFGANVGWATGRIEAEIPGVLRGSVGAEGAFGGVHTGFNFTSGSLLFGGEIDAQFSRISGGWEPIPGADVSGTLNWFSTMRGRIGVTAGNFLLYGTAGLAVGGGRAEASAGGLSASDTKIHMGWAAGGGIEYALNQDLSLRFEYLYADFDKKQYWSGLGVGAGAGFATHLIRVGATAHF